MDKVQIRKAYAAERKALSAQRLEEYTALITDRFRDIALKGISVALSYSPIEHRKEFDVRGCEQILAAEKITIAHPRIVAGSDLMEAVVIGRETLFSHNHLAIREPSAGRILTPESVDMVLTPLLAFDVRGYRVGYGKGFYDRWLAQCRPGIIKVGFSFFEPLDAISDINEFDVPLNLCITPMRVYEF